MPAESLQAVRTRRPRQRHSLPALPIPFISTYLAPSALGVGLAKLAGLGAIYLALALVALPALVAKFHSISLSAVISGEHCNNPIGVA